MFSSATLLEYKRIHHAFILISSCICTYIYLHRKNDFAEGSKIFWIQTRK